MALTPEEFVNTYYVDRMGTDSLKWDALQERFGDPDLISMWVADMEFRVPECVTESLVRRVEHGVFGYSFVPDSYYDAVIGWERAHHGYDVRREWIRISPGVVSALYWMVNMFTEPDDAVAILTPVYYPFHHAVKDSGRRLVTCDLTYEAGRFGIDLAAFERVIVENRVKLHIMCSPHNPAGRVWTERELEGVLEVCRRHGVLVISDEIHQDLTFDGHRHVPAATVAGGRYSGDVITCFAASKTFNLAGCLTSTIVIEDEALRRKWDEFTNVYHNVEVNTLGLTAVEAALRGGETWYEGLRGVLWQNYQTVVRALAEFPDVHVAPLEATYLVFVDLRSRVPVERAHDFVQGACRLAVDYGEWFGEHWAGCIRLNMATHPRIVREAVGNLVRGLRSL